MLSNHVTQCETAPRGCRSVPCRLLPRREAVAESHDLVRTNELMDFVIMQFVCMTPCIGLSLRYLALYFERRRQHADACEI